MDILFYYLPFLETIRDFIELGGPVLRVIGLVTLFMWMLIIERLVYMRTGHKKLVRKAHNIWDMRTDYSSWQAHQIRNRIISQVSANAERNLALIKTCVALCPLLGLLGTVTGMIITFQAITLYGAGDPKLMAGGISTALVTTVLGLVVAIPMVFLHTLVQSRAKRLTQILQEESAGMLSERAERHAAA